MDGYRETDRKIATSTPVAGPSVVPDDRVFCSSCGEVHIRRIRTPEEVRDVAALIAAARAVWNWYCRASSRLVNEMEALGTALACPDCDRYDEGHFAECPRAQPPA